MSQAKPQKQACCELNKETFVTITYNLFRQSSLFNTNAMSSLADFVTYKNVFLFPKLRYRKKFSFDICTFVRYLFLTLIFYRLKLSNNASIHMSSAWESLPSLPSIPYDVNATLTLWFLVAPPSEQNLNKSTILISDVIRS